MTRIIYQIHAQLLMTVVDLKWKGPDDSKPLESRHIIYSSGGESDGKSGDDGRDGDNIDESGGEESDGKEGDGI
jgi:hypothetical protein